MKGEIEHILQEALSRVDASVGGLGSLPARTDIGTGHFSRVSLSEVSPHPHYDLHSERGRSVLFQDILNDILRIEPL